VQFCLFDIVGFLVIIQGSECYVLVERQLRSNIYLCGDRKIFPLFYTLSINNQDNIFSVAVEIVTVIFYFQLALINGTLREDGTLIRWLGKFCWFLEFL
jgi:hypothetical protein